MCVRVPSRWRPLDFRPARSASRKPTKRVLHSHNPHPHPHPPNTMSSCHSAERHCLWLSFKGLSIRQLKLPFTLLESGVSIDSAPRSDVRSAPVGIVKTMGYSTACVGLLPLSWCVENTQRPCSQSALAVRTGTTEPLCSPLVRCAGQLSPPLSPTHVYTAATHHMHVLHPLVSCSGTPPDASSSTTPCSQGWCCRYEKRKCSALFSSPVTDTC